MAGGCVCFIYGNKTRLRQAGGRCPVRGLPVRHGGGSGAFSGDAVAAAAPVTGHGMETTQDIGTYFYGLRVRDGPVQRGGG